MEYEQVNIQFPCTTDNVVWTLVQMKYRQYLMTWSTLDPSSTALRQVTVGASAKARST
jgi:hypothetical protein